MPRKSKNKFDIHGDTILIMREGWDKLAFATYREDYFIDYEGKMFLSMIYLLSTHRGKGFVMDDYLMELKV